MLINDKIKKIRSEKKLTQQEFAKLLNTTRQSIGLIEIGDRAPSLKFITTLADKLKINLNWLLLDIGDMELTEYESAVHLQEKNKFLEKEVQVYREILEINQLIKNKKKK